MCAWIFGLGVKLPSSLHREAQGYLMTGTLSAYPGQLFLGREPQPGGSCGTELAGYIEPGLLLSAYNPYPGCIGCVGALRWCLPSGGPGLDKASHVLPSLTGQAVTLELCQDAYL